MKKITDIKFGFSDAENYRRRESKDLFNKIFLRTGALDKIGESNVFFLVGEKGTGKTAYAVYHANNNYKNILAIHKFIRETDYLKFIQLRETNQLSLSDYTDIWYVIIYLLLSENLYKSPSVKRKIANFPKFKAVKSAIDDYYENAFSPEITTALQFVEDSTRAAEVLIKHNPASLSGKSVNNTKETTNKRRFQTNLLTIRRSRTEKDS